MHYESEYGIHFHVLILLRVWRFEYPIYQVLRSTSRITFRADHKNFDRQRHSVASIKQQIVMDTYNAILLVLIAQYLFLFIGVVMLLLNYSKITKLEIQTKQLHKQPKC